MKNTPTNQLRLNMPKNKEITDFYDRFRQPIREGQPVKGTFIAIKNDAGGWWIYRSDTKNWDFKGTKLIQGSFPVEIEHNRPFVGLDWTNDEQYNAVVFLHYEQESVSSC